MHRTLFAAIERSQEKLSATQLQLATGTKAQDYADLGTEAVRTLSARSLLARQEAHGTVAKRLGTTLSIQDANISSIESTADSLRVDMMKAIGTGESPGLQEAIEAAFQQVRSALNANEGGIPLFAGSQTGELPFKPKSLAELAIMPATGDFSNDQVRAKARVAEGLNVEFGVLASDLGAKMMEAFRTLAQAGPFGEKVTPDQATALADAMKQIESGITQVRSINAENGRKHAQIETLESRAEQRTILLKDMIAKNEDADLAQVASDLTQRRTVLEASYSVYAQMSNLSLLQFLR
jgi:flagellar hook-associated protein 3 FlgL